MFEKATRLALRFPFKGLCTVEDLWNLSVEDLDSIYKTLNAKVRMVKEESLLQTKSKEDDILDLQIDIIKHIVTVKIKEAADRKAALEKLSQRKKILGIMASKQDAALENLSIEELQKKYDELGA
ncbi:MAG TPA: hypothetical protein PLR64_02720 [Candidatus Dojkabacteria bacterium]|nr:hypothetical protein [Candidatus Dojkabacteria bacterium]